MSLTTFLQQAHVAERLRKSVRMPLGRRVEWPLLVPGPARHPALVGTAFDYLLRFDLERRHSFAIGRPWLAAEGLARLKAPRLLPQLERTLHTAEDIVEQARRLHADFLASGRVTRELLRVLLSLSHIDAWARSGKPLGHFGYAAFEDIKDLQALFEAVPRDVVAAKSRCLLNPTFGRASVAVGGADADLVLDDTLVEIKTSVRPEVSREHLHQLVGYYLLAELAGIDRMSGPPVKQLGVYLARYGTLVRFSVAEILPPEARQELGAFFRAELRLNGRAEPKRQRPPST